MNSEDVKIGHVYLAEVSELDVPVRILARYRQSGFMVRSMHSGRPFQIMAHRLRPTAGHHWRYRAVGRRSGLVAEGCAEGCTNEVAAIWFTLVEIREATKRRRCRPSEVIDVEVIDLAGRVSTCWANANGAGRTSLR